MINNLNYSSIFSSSTRMCRTKSMTIIHLKSGKKVMWCDVSYPDIDI